MQLQSLANKNYAQSQLLIFKLGYFVDIISIPVQSSLISVPIK